MTERYSEETDVIVVGYGDAGAAAAITAYDNGASVIILEKMPFVGGNSVMSGGNMVFVKDPKGFAQYLKTISCKTVEDDIINTFVDGLMQVGDWIMQMGGELERFNPMGRVGYTLFRGDVTFPTIPGAETAEKWCVKQTETRPEPCGGMRLFRVLESQVEQRGIKVMTSTPAKELIRNQGGEIVGVIAESGGETIRIKARKGVILTCGGYENNDALKWDYLLHAPMTFLGNIGNTGDGIRIVQILGNLTT